MSSRTSGGMSSLRLRSGGSSTLHDAEAIEQILAEALLGDLGAQIAMRRRDDAHVDLAIAGGAERLDLLAVERAQQLGCSSSGSSPTSSMNSVPPCACTNAPRARRVAPVKAPRAWPNSSLSISVGGTAAQSNTTNGPLRALAARVDRLGAHFLAGAGLAVDEDRHVADGGARQQREELAHLQGASDEPAEAIAVGGRHRRAALAAQQLQLAVADAHDGAGADEDLAKARAFVKGAVLRLEVGDAHAVAEHLDLEVAARDLRDRPTPNARSAAEPIE